MYTIEFLCGLTGYSKNTIYNLCNDLGIEGVKGQVKGNPGKAKYSQEDMQKLLRYQTAVKRGVKKEEAIRMALNPDLGQ